MFDLSINENDRKWLSDNYPSLKVCEKQEKVTEIVGTLKFCMSFIAEGCYVINPDQNDNRGIKIEDAYEVRIELKSSEVSNLPQVYETQGRIKSIAVDQKLGLDDLHINPNGAACLCIKPEEESSLPNGFNLKDFFNNLAIPFFYAQSYFEKRKEWPWGDYGHGLAGLVEWYNRQRNSGDVSVGDFLKMVEKYKDWSLYQERLQLRRGIKGHHLCICGSGKKFRKCHKEVLEGLWKLRDDLKK